MQNSMANTSIIAYQNIVITVVIVLVIPAAVAHLRYHIGQLRSTIFDVNIAQMTNPQTRYSQE
jgi:hypothetical protein